MGILSDNPFDFQVQASQNPTSYLPEAITVSIIHMPTGITVSMNCAPGDDNIIATRDKLVPIMQAALAEQRNTAAS